MKRSWNEKNKKRQNGMKWNEARQNGTKWDEWDEWDKF